MDILSLLSFAVVGIVAGVLAGLLGISGGIVTVPCLFFIFNAMDLAPGYTMQLAIGTSLAAMTFNGIAATLAHHHRGAVLWDVVKKMAPGLVLGAILGAQVADLLPETLLKIIFGAFLFVVGIYFLKRFKTHHGEHKLPKAIGLSTIGLGIGGLSSILGIGGGIITVPILIHYKVADKKAIACSAATGMIISFIGAFSFLYFGWNDTQISWTIGYLYLPAFFIIGIFSFLSAKYGVKLAYYLSDRLLRRIFALVIMAIGLFMMVR
jgi:uncharacterized membrane protein YfcA